MPTSFSRLPLAFGASMTVTANGHVTSGDTPRTEPAASATNAPQVATTPFGFREQIAIVALLISLVALSIDAILPALDVIGADLRTVDPNAPQFMISALLVGLAVGQLFYGPISDSTGRRLPIYVGLVIFLIGSTVCMATTSFEAMLFGRFLQGLGAAGPRVVAIAMVRDQYSGPLMARVMSFAMTIFILVPAIAPAIGQLVLLLGSWRGIFVVFLVHGAVALIWFSSRQHETLAPADRRTFSVRSVTSAMGETIRHPVSRNYAISAGFVFGSFVGFLTSIQQIFYDVFALGEWFVIAFGVLSLAIGAASLTNSHLVMQFGMQRLCTYALGGLVTLSAVALLIAGLSSGAMSVLIFMALMLPCSFCFGILFGNFNALAMEPMGHIAGSAAAIIAALTSVVAVSVGTTVGQLFDGSVIPLFGGFLFAAVLASALLFWTEAVRRD